MQSPPFGLGRPGDDSQARVRHVGLLWLAPAIGVSYTNYESPS